MEKEWENLTPEEKREKRFKNWLEAPGVEFKSPEAKKAYQDRVTRLSRVMLLQEPDRVPVSLPAGNFPAYYAGVNLHTLMYDYDELRRALLKFLRDFEQDMDTFGGIGPSSGRAQEIIDYQLHKWPGHGLDVNASSHQFVERENMRADEYDALIRNPSDYAVRVFMPRVLGALEPLKMLPHFSILFATATSFIAPTANPDVRAALQAMIDAGIELEKRQKVADEVSREVLTSGFPSMRGGMAMAPFDTVGDILRGTRGVFMDIYRHPDKLHEAMDKMADLTIERVVSTADNISNLMVSFPLHKGDDTFMSDEQFETFYWPSLKKVILGIINEGLMVSLFAEGRYNNRLKQVNDLPKGWVTWRFDQTDMARAKEVLGDSCCISGNVPASLMCTGTPQDIKEYCRKLIESCGKGGGYILAGGCSATETTAENLRAMMAAASEYGMY